MLFGLGGTAALPACEDLQTVLKKKSSEAGPKTGLIGGPSLPQKTSVQWSLAAGVCCDGARARPLCQWLFAWGGEEEEQSLGRAVSPVSPGPARPCVRERLGSVQWQDLGTGHKRLGSLSFCFQCLVLASESINSLSLLCC